MDLIKAVKAMGKGKICLVNSLKYRLNDGILECQNGKFDGIKHEWTESMNPIITLCEDEWELSEEKKTLSDKLLVKSEIIVMNNNLDNPTDRFGTEKDVKEHLKEFIERVEVKIGTRLGSDEEEKLRDILLFIQKDAKEIFGERLIK